MDGVMPCRSTVSAPERNVSKSPWTPRAGWQRDIGALSSSGWGLVRGQVRTAKRDDVLFLDDASTPGSSTSRVFTPTVSTTSTSTMKSRTLSNMSRKAKFLGRKGEAPGIVYAISPSASPAPQWSMRYCEYMGSQFEAAQVVKRSRDNSMAHESAAETSIFLQKATRDKRLQKLDDTESPERPSRKEARRVALSGFGPSRLRANAAVRIMSLKRPDRFRNLLKACKQNKANDFLPKIETTKMSDKTVEGLSEQVGIPAAEIQTLYEAFSNYAENEEGGLNRDELRRVLGDIGLQPRTREEKVGVKEVLELHEIGDDCRISLQAYVSLVIDIRDRLAQIQYVLFIKTFGEPKVNGHYAITLEDVLRLLGSKMGLVPRTDDEQHEVNFIFSSVDTDCDGKLQSIEDCQTVAQRIRMKLTIMRHEEEATIAKAFKLTNSVIEEFRYDLPMLWEVFNRYTHDSKNIILAGDLCCFLSEIGVAPPATHNTPTMAAVLSAIMLVGGDENEFPHVLQIIRHARKRCKEVMVNELMNQFSHYDKHKQGELSFPELFVVVEDFQLLPKSREEQEEMLVVLERLDTDGSGTFDFAEFQEFFQRLMEQLQQNEHKRENKAVLELGYDESELLTLRRVFVHMHTQGRKANVQDSLRACQSLKEEPSFKNLDMDKVKEELVTQARAGNYLFSDFTCYASTIRTHCPMDSNKDSKEDEDDEEDQKQKEKEAQAKAWMSSQ
eukprot:TRINITY_DN1578_c0_g2_i1.p1 TRINITY_DN1578_c0_g2~~TRINITY_DN1578_c0_g2_i1.p1  ORF type:complete len:726 (-),score=158.25 TRINITY_DN1578_c0_g2_i1:183-2360(-)